MCLQVKNQNESDKVADELVKMKDENVAYYKRFLGRPFKGPTTVYKPDILATSTQLTRQAFIKIQTIFDEGQKTTSYK
jgi:hypothetical protein